MSEDGASEFEPLCVASTIANDKLRQGSENSERQCEDIEAAGSHDRPNHFKSVEWSSDGTTILTDSADHHIRTYILPQDLLDEDKLPHKLSPYSTLPSAEPTYASALYPFFSLQDPSTTLFLSSVRDHPIRLTSALAPISLASYSLVNPTTEAFITPNCMLYPSALGGTHFLTGSDSLICLFDVSRPGNDGPLAWMPTIPSKRKRSVGGGVGMKGVVSAMAVNPTENKILAAGTFSRSVGLYESCGSGQSLGTFTVSKTIADRYIRGSGITQLLWSPCGRYLYIAERKSDGIMVYDIRVTGQLLGWLQGRKALTNQRMKVDLVPTSQGESHEIWAGGIDGFVRVWENPTHTAGSQEPKWEWKMHDDSVSGVVLHPMGNIAATVSGQRHFTDNLDMTAGVSSTTGVEDSLKVWYLPFLEEIDDI